MSGPRVDAIAKLSESRPCSLGSADHVNTRHSTVVVAYVLPEV